MVLPKGILMRNVITQTVLLAAPPARLFEMYLDPTVHAAITGAPVTISREPGSEFQAFGGVLTGTTLAVYEPQLIVQSWRSSQFRPEDPDSTLILSFPATAVSGQIDLVHLDVPDHDYTGVTEGWEKYYWTPWRNYLQSLR
jgi:activator of HSP90 ATPase